jgi:hypothetical protein
MNDLDRVIRQCERAGLKYEKGAATPEDSRPGYGSRNHHQWHAAMSACAQKCAARLTPISECDD